MFSTLLSPFWWKGESAMCPQFLFSDSVSIIVDSITGKTDVAWLFSCCLEDRCGCLIAHGKLGFMLNVEYLNIYIFLYYKLTGITSKITRTKEKRERSQSCPHKHLHSPASCFHLFNCGVVRLNLFQSCIHPSQVKDKLLFQSNREGR